jgi:hypothetical protein
MGLGYESAPRNEKKCRQANAREETKPNCSRQPSATPKQKLDPHATLVKRLHIRVSMDFRVGQCLSPRSRQTRLGRYFPG